jgi:hypothetical protein
MSIFDKFTKFKNKHLADKIMAKLNCDCQLLKEQDVEGVMKRYRETLMEGKRKGYTPLLIIPSETMLELLDPEAHREYLVDDRETILGKAKEIDVEELLNNLQEGVMSDEDDDEYDITGEFSIEESPKHFLSIEEDLNEKIILAKIPTDKPWEVAAWVPMGGFNECPLPEEQVAIFKYWHDKYRATPAVVTPDIWELYVENPPKTQEEAVSLAWEQFGFCGDIVWQGVGSVNGLAGTLIHSKVWYFWWD